MENTDIRKSKRIFFICVILLFFIIGFGGGYFFGIWSNYRESASYEVKKEIVDKSNNNANNSIDFTLFWQVWNKVKKNYLYQPVDETKMFYGALAGITASIGDPYSIFMDPEMTKSFSENISGSFEGIGAEIGAKEKNIVIIAPLAGMPAEKAGILAGDVLLAIDDTDTTDMNVDFAVKLMRGKKGTEVKLLVKRDGKDPQEIKIIRDVIKIDSVKWEMKDYNNKKIAYITITNFNEDTSNKFNEAINNILLEQPSGIILDLRNNPGGLLSSSIEVASKFINSGPIVFEQFQDGVKKEYKSLGGAQLSGIKTMVLVNGGSASAAEILAGAIQDSGTGEIIGEKTFGKGSVQDYQTFKDGSSMKITVAKWLTPKGNSINETGIIPDHEVAYTKEDADSDIDPQMNYALEQF